MPKLSEKTQGVKSGSEPAVVETFEDDFKENATKETFPEDVDEDIEEAAESKVAHMVEAKDTSAEASKAGDIFNFMDGAETDTEITQVKVITEVTRDVVAETGISDPVSDVVECAEGEDIIADENGIL